MAGRQTAPPRQTELRPARAHEHPSALEAGRCHHARIESISAAISRDAATSSGSLRNDSASARRRALRWARSASRIAALAASERETPSRVNASRARSTSGSVRIVSELIRHNVTQISLLGPGRHPTSAPFAVDTQGRSAFGTVQPSLPQPGRHRTSQYSGPAGLSQRIGQWRLSGSNVRPGHGRHELRTVRAAFRSGSGQLIWSPTLSDRHVIDLSTVDIDVRHETENPRRRRRQRDLILMRAAISKGRGRRRSGRNNIGHNVVCVAPVDGAIVRS